MTTEEGTIETRCRLVFRYDEEFPVRIVNICKMVADTYSRLPAFRHCSSEQILEYLAVEVLNLLSVHGLVSETFDSDSTLGTFHATDISVNYDGLCCDLAASAFEHFALAGHVPPPSIPEL